MGVGVPFIMPVIALHREYFVQGGNYVPHHIGVGIFIDGDAGGGVGTVNYGKAGGDPCILDGLPGKPVISTNSCCLLVEREN